jgi:tricarballylate dehydrogenase
MRPNGPNHVWAIDFVHDKLSRQPGQRAWQIFDSKVFDLLYEEYRFYDAKYEEADSLKELLKKCNGLDAIAAEASLKEFNANTDPKTAFDPTIKDGKSSTSAGLSKSNWAQSIDAPPFRAYPVTGGITFTYGGVKISSNASIMDKAGSPMPGLFACGEMVGGVFWGGYPGGSGLTSGAVFGRIAGVNAAELALNSVYEYFIGQFASAEGKKGGQSKQPLNQ